MSRIITIAGKELRLLGRDRAGLLVLFLMPAILVVIITLVQTNVMQRSGLVKTRALFLDLDGQAVGSALHKLLNTENLQLVGGNKKEKTAFDLEKAVRNGKYQVGIVVPKGSTKILRRNIAHLFAKPAQKNEKTPLEKVRLKVFFDPGIMPGLRAGITARLQMAVQTLSFEEKFSEKLYIQKEELCFQSKEREIEALIHFLQKLVKKSLGKNEKMKRKIHNSLQKEELEKKFL